MALAQRGDRSAYRTLLQEIYPWLHRFFGRRFPPMQAEDAVQDVLVALHQKRDTFEPGKPFRRWLAAIARYKRIDYLRAHYRNNLDALPDGIASDGHEAPVTSAIVVSTILAQLKPAQADAIRLVRLEGYSVRETSAATGQSESLVKINVHRGLGKFATMIAASEMESSA
ncbi:sigma-70 family RNA polymerase sigma factor [Sphingomonas suaedae]|uniref:Sigma-70 family RNA polymerase sigma factor n=2 Tax=Sphingomonas suaedae TaxID=2599297 RepID=A0A518RLF6_9SPHN|nr:sigma-70 family RNA polymerase sigma factor [Sphingomonas suaedae]